MEELNLNKEVKFYMVFDILGDIVRSGPQLWKIERERLEDVKNHVLDLILIVRILKKYLPKNLDYNKIYNYILCHDLPEVITGDITKFEGVSDEEKNRVTNIAIDYLSKKFNDVIDLDTILNSYENRVDIESKIVHMIDKVHSSISFMKYQSECNVDMDNPDIIESLRNHPFVLEKISEGKDLADIFFEFHIRSVNITLEECVKYKLSFEDKDRIIFVIKSFAHELYNQKLNKTLLNGENDFPIDAMKYNKRLSRDFDV